PLPLGIGVKVQFWLPLVLLIDGKPLVPFFDPRRSLRLTEEARRFAFSVMHERIRVADPDLAAVGLGIFQFNETKGQGRVLKLHTDAGVELYSFDELDAMVVETYSLWREVLAEREEGRRERANGRRGSLL